MRLSCSRIWNNHHYRVKVVSTQRARPWYAAALLGSHHRHLPRPIWRYDAPPINISTRVFIMLTLTRLYHIMDDVALEIIYTTTWRGVLGRRGEWECARAASFSALPVIIGACVYFAIINSGQMVVVIWYIYRWDGVCFNGFDPIIARRQGRRKARGYARPTMKTKCDDTGGSWGFGVMTFNPLYTIERRSIINEVVMEKLYWRIWCWAKSDRLSNRDNRLGKTLGRQRDISGRKKIWSSTTCSTYFLWHSYIWEINWYTTYGKERVNFILKPIRFFVYIFRLVRGQLV